MCGWGKGLLREGLKGQGTFLGVTLLSPGVGYQPGRRCHHRTPWTPSGQPRHPLTVHSQISPVREFSAAITFFSVATTSFLDPGENSKEANLSFPTYCCLLKERGKENRRGQCHRCTGHFANTGGYHRHTCLGMHENCLLMKRSDQKRDFQAMCSGTEGRRRENTP